MGKICYHCGSTTGNFIDHENQDFCCQGCVTVYDILKENKLYTYYDLENNPGIRKAENTSTADYSYLEQEEIKTSVLDFYDGQIAKIRLSIPSIHCSSCIWLLENLGRLNKGILNSVVNFTNKEVSISFDESKIRLPEVMYLLESIHYKPIIREKGLHKKRKTNSSLLIKLGIAGFAFGNVMLLSFPDYLSESVSINDSFIQYFGLISLLLSLPVLFYSASDYFLSAWKNILKKSISIDLPIALGIATIFIRSIYELITTSGTGYFDSLTGLVFFLLIGKWYQDKTYQALNFESDYTSYFPLGITREQDGKQEIIPIRKLKVGNRILVRNTEIIPADSVLDAEEALIDYSFITGESIPVKKTRGDKIFAGGRQIGKTIELLVEKEVETSYLAQLWKERKEDHSNTTFISATLDKVSTYFTWAILTISSLSGVFWLLNDSSLALVAFSSVLIVACPCALALSAPFTFGHAQRIMGNNGIFLKHSSVVEKMANINTVVFDKTGTLTESSMFDVSADVALQNRDLLNEVKSVVKHSFHPLSRTIYNYLIDNEEYVVDEFDEFVGKGVIARVNGKLIRVGSKDFTTGNIAVLSDTSTRVHVSVDEKYAGAFHIKNFYRPNWKEVVKTIAQRYDFHLLSGDNDRERQTIAQVVGNDRNLNFDQSPKDKLEYIRQLKAQGRKVLMIGDGLNDSGALNESDVGIAVAEDIYQFSPASDAIVKAESLGKIHKLLDFSRSAMSVVWVSIIFSFLYNLVGIWYAASGRLSPLFAAILMPLSSVTVVILATVLTQLRGRKHKL